ncbi:MAG: rRNA maturation RNase YbeY [Gemmataceae bacterium]|jgi:probable rRNA maturation factor|nr:rRNA maturation RNase YbeY [Gemmataceae bacterium]
MIRVSIANPQEKVEIPFARFKEIVRGVLEGEKIKEAKISLAMVDDTTSARINQQFLQHEGPTDVITFPLSKPKAKVLEGELVLGVEVALREAEGRGHTFEEEMSLYIIHGLLHLCGFDDHTPEETQQMRAKEKQYLAHFGIADISGE